MKHIGSVPLISVRGGKWRRLNHPTRTISGDPCTVPNMNHPLNNPDRIPVFTANDQPEEEEFIYRVKSNGGTIEGGQHE